MNMPSTFLFRYYYPYKTLITISAILFFGTVYSVVFQTYLDTSNPLLTHLPHPLAKTHYFASKTNFLNVYFIKQAWGWTSGVFFLNYFVSPSTARTKARVYQFLLLTGVWIVFTRWFFGAAILERVIVHSGGECVAHLPTGDHVTVPNELCYNRALLTPETHPDFFMSAALTSPEVHQKLRIVPRLRKGHDISGHVFLLTMSLLFLAEQMRFTLSRRVGYPWTNERIFTATAEISLFLIWFLAEYTTAVYFHSPLEKLSGYLLGVAAFTASQRLFGDINF